MTFNVRFDKHSPEQVLAAIRYGNADVIAIQELTTSLDDYLWQHLQTHYPYRQTAAADWPWGSGIYSRYPITLVENRAWYMGLLDTQEALLTWEGQEVRFLNFHPVPPTLSMSSVSVAGFSLPKPDDYRADVRHEQVGDLIARLRENTVPLVLACDCNFDPASHDYEELSHLLIDGFREAGWGFGHTLYFNDHPNPFQHIPLVRIDYVFHSQHWQTVQASVLPFASSNHRPVVIKLVMP